MFSAKTTWPALPLTRAATSHPSPVTPLPSSSSLPSASLQSPAHPQAQQPGNFLDAQAGRSTECVSQTPPGMLASLSSTWATSPPPLPLPPASRVGGVDVAATATRALGRAGGRWASDSGERERDVTLSSLFSFLFLLLLDSVSLSPHLRLPVHVTLCSLLFPPPPSFLPVSSPFYSVGSSLRGRTTVLLKQGQKVRIFPEPVGSDLVSLLLSASFS